MSTDVLDEAVEAAVAARPIGQIRRMHQEISEAPERKGVVLQREGYAEREWAFAEKRLNG